MTYPSESRGERGSALLMALMVLAVLLLLGSAFLSGSLSERSIAVNETNSGKSFNFAEAGIEHTRGLLPATDIDALLLAGGNLFNGQSLDQGSYTVDVTNNVGPTYPRGGVPVDPGGATDDTDEYVVLRSTGNFWAAERTIEVVVEKEILPLPYGMYGRDLIDLSASGTVTMDIGSNGDIEMNGGIPDVIGNAEAGGTVQDPSKITGTSTDGANPVFLPEIACPTMAYGTAPAGAGVNFNAGTGDLQLNGGTDKTFTAGVYYFHDFSKVGGASMIIPVGDIVEIYISGQLMINGGGFVNENAAAGFLKIWACGNDTSNWSLTGSVDVWLIVYAPNHDLTLTGSADKYGSFVGADLISAGSGDLFYDAGLELETNHYVTVPGTWAESGL
jgi:hypothetical protein